MGNEHGEWIMHGLSDSDPRCIKTVDALVEYIDHVGFLPLFANGIEGFSVEEHTNPDFWWSGVIERDPWEWRAIIARSGKVAYGKFFDKKAGFVSLSMLPHFVNYRRSGYDFDSRAEEGLASHKCRRIMSCFEGKPEISSPELKELAGFGKGGEKNFDGTVTELMMQTYLAVRDFRQRTNKKGELYGWALAVYAAPETLWGSELVRSAYAVGPEESLKAVIDKIRSVFPDADDRDILKLIK